MRGRNVLVRGTPGAGKTIFGLYFLSAGIAADERSLYVNLGEPQAYVEETADAFDLQTEGTLFQFEETERTIRKRADVIGIPLQKVIDWEHLSIVEVEPDEYTVGEFEQLIREAVDEGIELVMIDGMQGFKQNLRGLEDPTAALLRVGRYLRSTRVRCSSRRR